MQRTHQIDQADTKGHRNDTHDNTYLGHIVLLHMTCGKSQGIGRRGNRQDHG